MSDRIERCCACDEPTERAGASDDSLFTDQEGIGPFCDHCYEGARHAESVLLPTITALRARVAELESAGKWISVEERLPEAIEVYGDFKNKPYVLIVDAIGRMSVGYLLKYKGGTPRWVSAKTINFVTHWQPLPPGPGKEK